MEEKRTTIVVEDSLNMNDKTNMGNINNFTKSIFKEYGINPDELFKNGTNLKPIPPQWIPEIIQTVFNKITIKPAYFNEDKSERSFVMSFDTEEERNTYLSTFNSIFLKVLNDFITSKNENPNNFNRVLIIESTAEDKSRQLILRY